MGEEKRSIFTYLGENVSSHCGYCKVEAEDKFTHGMWAHCMRTSDYQALIDRGWRRSGQYCYKPTMDKTCCPPYTIRCPVETVPLTGSQKRVMNRVSAFLRTGDRPKTAQRLNANALANKDSNGAADGESEAGDEPGECLPPHRGPPKDCPATQRQCSRQQRFQRCR